MEEPIIKTANVTKTYRISAGAFKGNRSLHAVNGVSISVKRGSVLGLVGESGCGKSTMAKMILRIEEISSGEIYMDGKAVSSVPRRQIARRVQPIFQDPYSSLNPRKNIASIITLPLRALKIGSPSEWDAKVDEIMKVVGLAPRLKFNYPNQLSGGQRQRVAVARALIIRPALVLCDEPTSALDVSVQSQILNLLIDLRKEFGLTYILISHNLAVVQHMASRVAVMYLGRIVEEADSQMIFRNPLHPYTQALLKSVLAPDPHLGLPETHLGIVYPNPIDPPPGCTFHPRCPKADEQCSREAPQATVKDDHLVECHYPESAA